MSDETCFMGNQKPSPMYCFDCDKYVLIDTQGHCRLCNSVPKAISVIGTVRLSDYDFPEDSPILEEL